MSSTTLIWGCDLRLVELKLSLKAWLVGQKDKGGYTLLNVRMPDRTTRLMKVYGWTPSPRVFLGEERSVDLIIRAVDDRLCAVRINLHDEEEIEHFIYDGS